MDEHASFVCGQCGKRHEGLLSDTGFKLPDEVFAIPEAERNERAKWDTDVCVFDGARLFIRCILRIPFTQREGYYGWGIWVEVDRPVIERYLELWESDGQNEPLKAATLANCIPGYDDPLGTSVSIQFGAKGQRPDVFADPDSSPALSNDQVNGIDDTAYFEILHREGAV